VKDDNADDGDGMLVLPRRVRAGTKCANYTIKRERRYGSLIFIGRGREEETVGNSDFDIMIGLSSWSDMVFL
jgi:predicted nucleotidyltransferase